MDTLSTCAAFERAPKERALDDFDRILDHAWETYEAGDAAQALKLYEDAITQWPDRTDPWYEKGLVLKETGETEKAMACFDHVLSLDPDDYRAMVKRADVLIWDFGEYEKGFELCKEAKKRGPDLATAAEISHWSALALLYMGQLDEALREIDSAIKKAVPTADDYSLKGEIQIRRGDPKAALAPLSEAIVLEPTNGYFHYLYGYAFLYLGKEQTADKHFRRASELNPDQYRVPCRMPEREFDLTVRRAVGALPAWVTKHLHNVEVSIEDLPPKQDLLDGLDFDVLGAYYGHGEPNRDETELPERIILFQRNLETFCGNRDELREEIEKTVIHEVAHRFNIDDDKIR
ncbi:MAG: metallopeptidase family protein, partial [Candidatus Methylomirabilis sp.]|nr:metallopeptidase family protein [Deltaproteobacteria bacterium]